MKKHLTKIKGVNDHARILGVDVGRKYTGLAISDKEIKRSLALKTLINDSQDKEKVLDLQRNNAMYGEMRKII